MRLWASLGLIAGIGWMSGCGPVAPRVVDAKYRKASLDGRLLRVMPIHSLDVHNMDDFRDDFGGGGGAEDPGRVLSDLFGEAIFSLVDRAEVLYDDVPIADSQFQDTVLSVPAKQEARAVTFRFPSDSALRERKVDPDMVLQIVDLQVHRDWRPGGGAGGHLEPALSGLGRVPGGAGAQPTFLYLNGKYLIWDYRSGAPIAYGVLEGLSGYHSSMSRETWEAGITQAVYDLLKGTPLMSSTRSRTQPKQARKSGR